MSVGTPYMFLNEDYYYQYADYAGIYFNNDNEFVEEINKILDDENYRKEYSDKSKELAGKNTWKEIVKQYNEHFVLAEKELNEIKQETDSYKKIIKYISTKKSVTKRQLKAYLNWGIRIPFNIYRNRLRKEKSIKLTKFLFKH